MSLSWNAVPGAASYNVKRSTTSGGAYTVIASQLNANGYTDTGVKNGTTYYYVVTAANEAGESANSAEASATPTAPLQAPASPSGLTAVKGNRQISLNWGAVTGAASYNVYQSRANNGPYAKIASNVTSPIYTVTGLSKDTTYYYVVTAVNAAGESAYSNQASARTEDSGSGRSSSSTGGNPANPGNTGTNGINGNNGNGTSSSANVILDPADDAKVTRETTADGRAVTRVAVDADKLNKVLSSVQGSSVITLEIKSTDPVVQVDLPASSLSGSAESAFAAKLQIKADGTAYILPVGLLKNLTKNGAVSLTISRVSGKAGEAIEAAARITGAVQLATPAQFSLTAGGEEVTDFGGVYVDRILTLHTPADDPDKVTAVWFGANGQLHFVPALVNGAEATIRSPHNSIYTVVRTGKTFEDLQGHWAKTEVELLAGKLIVNGTSDKLFSPDDRITRAEFAALLVRALGLADANGAAGEFKDVKRTDWFAGSTAAAVKAGLVSGFEDGTFRPDAGITREQMAAMIARAMKAGGKEVAADQAALGKFADRADIADWSRDAVAQALAAGVIQGTNENLFSAKADATRAQAAVMLKRMLQFMQFIN
ncbi:S-layer homology domain-containing protein [Paenibacillus hamazuiensis]|uniref:S-layer homology domain-containing protein n=1 Tax=Paenibacillus hamazuiensis TaxID=2936508 RepID=UPI00200EF1A2